MVGRIRVIATSLWLVCFTMFAITQPRAQGERPKEPFRDCSHCPEMIVIPAGSFLMGSSESDTKRDLAAVPPLPPGMSIDKLLGITQRQRAVEFMAYEHPQHRVTIRKDFALSKFPVTTEEFAVFIAATDYRTASCHVLIGNHMSFAMLPAWQHPGFGVTGRDPVVCVSWNDAQAYIAWLNSKVAGASQGSRGYPYHLPSEAEWEYAARAGTVTSRWWGNGISAANCNGCGHMLQPPAHPSIEDGLASAPLYWHEEQQRTTAVGSYPANPFGLYDILGNVMEWAEDCWHPDYTGAPTDGEAWGSEDCSSRVVRGSGWDGDGTITWPVRSATRTAFDKTNALNLVGFRVAKIIP